MRGYLVERSPKGGWQWRRILPGGIQGLPVGGFKTKRKARDAARAVKKREE